MGLRLFNNLLGARELGGVSSLAISLLSSTKEALLKQKHSSAPGWSPDPTYAGKVLNQRNVPNQRNVLNQETSPKGVCTYVAQI